MRYLTSETIIRNSNLKNLSGVNFDNKLKIEKYIITICQRTNNNESLCKIRKEMNANKSIFQFSV